MTKPTSIIHSNNPPFAEVKEWFDENGNQIYVGSCNKKLKQDKVLLILPYFDSANEIRIYGENNILQLKIDVSYLKIHKQKNWIPLYIILSIGVIIFILLIMSLVKKRRKKRK